MRKWNQYALCALLCAAMAVSTGCSLKDKLGSLVKGEKSNGDYVTLGDYENISLKKSDVDKDVNNQINETLETYVSYQEVKKGKVKDGDTANIYYVGRINGKKFDGGSCTKKDTPSGYDLTIGSNQFLDGFEEQLVGKKVGDTVKVNVTFPDPYQNNPDYSGKKAVFTVTINYIRGDKIYPKLDEEFVKENLPSYKSVDDYKSTLRGYSLEDLAWDQVYGASTVNEYPQERLDEMYNQLHTSITYYLKQNNYKLSDYLSAQKITSEDFKSQLQDTAKKDVGKKLVYGAIAEKEGLEVSDEDYESSLKTYMENYNCKDEAELDKIFQNYYGTKARDIIEDDLLFKKVRDYLVSHTSETE